MHAAGILHRDIKTGNLLTSRDGSSSVKLGDFGIAELAADLEEEQRHRGSLVSRGKPSGGFHKRHLVSYGCRAPKNPKNGCLHATVSSPSYECSYQAPVVACKWDVKLLRGLGGGR